VTVLDLFVIPRGERSRTRKVRAVFFEAFAEQHADEPRIELDLVRCVDELPRIDEWDVEARFEMAYGEGNLDETMAQRWSAMTRFTDQLHAARLIVVSTPMWNFSIPWYLKRWIDTIVQARLTFEIHDGRFSGLLEDKRVVVLTSRDGVYSAGSPTAPLDFQLPYLRAIFGFIGCSDVSVVSADGMASDDASASLIAACEAARALARTL
jgi:FMN-dependent NADH-azoreductase